MVEGRDEDEWRKRLTAKLRDIPSMLLIDNLRRQLDASSVAAALTAPYWEDRVLGKSEMTRFPIRCVWIATGNNPQFSNEIARPDGAHPARPSRGPAVAARGLSPSEPVGVGLAEPSALGGRVPHARPRLDRRRQAAAPENHRQLRGLG
jgi:hypothetical protein